VPYQGPPKPAIGVKAVFPASSGLHWQRRWTACREVISGFLKSNLTAKGLDGEPLRLSAVLGEC
jgi:hypothetical protein